MAIYKEICKETMRWFVQQVKNMAHKPANSNAAGKNRDFPGMGPHSFFDHSKQNIVYSSPKYSKSRTVQLDPNIAVENKCIAVLFDAPEIEPYRILRTQILHRLQETGGKTIMFTSAIPDEGKTITAINLSLTFAKDFHQTVLLVDADLKKQMIHKYFSISSYKGIADHLLTDEPVSDLIVWPGIDKLTFISGGRPVWESAELLGSPKMKDMVHEMKERYQDRYVFFDVPPVLSGADALAFSPMVDAIVFVIKVGKTSMIDIKRALDILPKEKIIGLVLNQKPTASKKKSLYGERAVAVNGTS